MNFNHYFTNQEIQDLLTRWKEEYPGLIHVSTLGESYLKQTMPIISITNQKTGSDTTKPGIWIDANIHATEISGTTAALRFANELLENYGAVPRVTSLLDSCVYYIAPRLNPDGAALAIAKTPKYIRSGVRPYPWNDKDQGLHEEDIDNDGRILQIRIPDPNGDWKKSHLDPRLLEKREPDENGGEYYRLIPEGRIEGFDGYTIKFARPFQGLDFNRNFPFEWRPEAEQSGAGPYPGSEPEIKAVMDFITNHPNINIAVTFHTFSRVILRPYSTKSDNEMDTHDLWVYKKIGEIGTHTTGYRCVSTFHDFKYHPKEVTTGAFDDWLYDHLGVYSFTIELWDLPTEAGIKDRKFIDWFREHPHEEDLQIIKWIDENAEPGSFVEWYPFDHPQLGEVELGGWNSMFTWRNPPKEFIGAEADKTVPFLLKLGDLLPHLKIHTLYVSKLGQEDYHINLVLENSGFIPSYTSNQGKQRKATRPLRVELVLPETIKLISGKRITELSDLEGRSNKLDVSTIWETGETDNRGRVEWVINAPPGEKIKIKIVSDRAGSLEEILTISG